MIPVLASLAAALSGVGMTICVVAARSVAAHFRRPKREPRNRPGITVLKPLHGDEPLLAEALETVFIQDYPEWQIVFGVQSANDPAIAVVRSLHERYPDRDVVLVVDDTQYGRNRKVGNLINMLPHARHNVLVIADSDVHVLPDYLKRLVAALEIPGVGLVTTLYAGLPPASGVIPSLGKMQITHGFLPSAVLSRSVGRRDCLGATMCLRRRDLVRIGGLEALVDHLADDNVLGRLILAQGRDVVLADTVVLTTVPETTLGALFRHELRWARTIRALEAVGFAASLLQYPLAWALFAVVLSGGAFWSLGLLIVAWVVRGVAAHTVDSALSSAWTGKHAGALRCPIWLLPVREVLSAGVVFASYASRRVDWRGHALHADTPILPATTYPIKEVTSQ